MGTPLMSNPKFVVEYDAQGNTLVVENNTETKTNSIPTANSVPSLQF